MKNSNQFYFSFRLSLFFILTITTKTFVSVQSGNWTINTWNEVENPSKFNDNVRVAGQTVSV
jgi:hypothetical protein